MNKITIAHILAREFGYKTYLDDDRSVVLWKDDSDVSIRITGPSPEFPVIISRRSTAQILWRSSILERDTMNEISLIDIFVNLMEVAGQAQDLMRR